MARPAIGLTILALIYLATVLPSLEDDPIAGGDEGWIISSSARLAREGAFGTDLFAGFYGAEDHYYFNLPLHHLVLAAVFKIAGVGLDTARLVSVVFGLATLLLTYYLGRRVGGATVGLAAAALLVFLRLNLAPFSGLTLTDLGATVRYDLITVPFSLGAALALLQRPQPSVRLAALAGFLTGLGALTQFIGAFVAVPFALFLLSAPTEMRRRLLLMGTFGIMMALPFVPYFGYIALDTADFAGQARAVEQRTDFFSPSFYVEQLRREPERYATATGLESAPDSISGLFSRPSARLTLAVLAPAALLLMLWRGREDRRRLLIAITLLALVAEIALFESTKRWVYWVIAVPYLCIALADLAVTGWAWFGSRPQKLAEQLAIAAIATILLVEGAAVAAKDLRDAPSASSYREVGASLAAELPSGSIVIGDNRLWPALDAHGIELRSLLLLFYHTNPRISKGRETDIRGAFERIGAQYVLLSPLSREILAQLTPEDARDFETYMREHATLQGTVTRPGYGPTEIYRLR